MKTKYIAIILFLIGLVLIICEAGTDDYATQINQERTLNWIQLVIGLLMCVPLPIVLNQDEFYEQSGKAI